jgi:hypothetical protein
MAPDLRPAGRPVQCRPAIDLVEVVSRRWLRAAEHARTALHVGLVGLLSADDARHGRSRPLGRGVLQYTDAAWRLS